MRETHGLSKTPEYRIWAGIIQRCCNPKRKEYERYGGAGVTICAEWRDSFAAFFAHIGERPTPEHSIDRIDGAKGYEPGNVRWATPEVQAQNTSIARPVTFNGRTMTVSEWARETGIGFTTIIARLNRGYPVEQVLSVDRIVHSAQTPKNYLTFEGETKTVREWADELGLKKSTLKKRIAAGHPVEWVLREKSIE